MKLHNLTNFNLNLGFNKLKLNMSDNDFKHMLNDFKMNNIF